MGFLLSPKEIGHDMNIVLLHKKAAACFYSYCSDVHFRENVQEDTEHLLQLQKVLQHKRQPLAVS